jgi:hypothetical protein
MCIQSLASIGGVVLQLLAIEPSSCVVIRRMRTWHTLNG